MPGTWRLGLQRKITLFTAGKISHLSHVIYKTKCEHSFSWVLRGGMGFWPPCLMPEPPSVGSTYICILGWGGGCLVLRSCSPVGLRGSPGQLCASSLLQTLISPFWVTAHPPEVPICQTIRLSPMKRQTWRNPLCLLLFSPSPFSALFLL